MKSSYLKNQRLKGGWVKYFIFNIILFGAFFALQANKVSNIKAAGTCADSYEILNSNYTGNGNDYDAFVSRREKVSSPANVVLTNYSVQGTGVTMEDVVVIKITKCYNSEIRSIAVFESGYTTSGNRNYDVYRKGDSNDTWTSLQEGNEIRLGNIEDDDSFAATKTTLKANDASGSYYSLMYINDDTTNKKLEIQYAYTIRKAGYGFKEVYFAYYNDVPSQTPAEADADSVTFIVSKPINEMGFTWVDDDTTTACGESAVGSSEATANICAYYKNDTVQGNQAKQMKISLPKETAYVHTLSSVDPITVEAIKTQTVYAINDFKNNGGSGNVRYYYYKFVLSDSAFGTSGTKNDVLDPTLSYYMYVMIDAKGDYKFFLEDAFGNTFESPNSDKVKVDDVSITKIIVDHTNEDVLTLMDVTTAGYPSDNWKNEWTFVVGNSIDFTKMQKDSVQIVIHVFQKVVINEGIFSGASDEGETFEDISKSPLGYNDGSSIGEKETYFTGVEIWRVSTPTSDDGNKASGILCQNHDSLCKSGSGSTIEFSETTTSYGVAGIKNKITLTVKSNGRYRIMITDNHTNTTNSTDNGTEKNPAVEVSVIDRYAPVVASQLGASGSEINVETYEYVMGGGKNNPVVPNGTLATNYWENTNSYETIYYKTQGINVFDYQDIINRAKIYAADKVYSFNGTGGSFSEEVYNDYLVWYHCSDGSATCDGSYNDPSRTLKSNRNTTSTTVTFGSAASLHEYIINKNITSFTGGLLPQVSQTTRKASGGTVNSYAVSTTNPETDFVKGVADYFTSTETYLGYLKIVFYEAGSTTKQICEITATDKVSDAAVKNRDCFNLINKYVDDVEDFDMVFTTQDYNAVMGSRHDSESSFTIKVKIVDTTAPGIDMTGADVANSIYYNNEPTLCRLEIGNYIQLKDVLLDCYKLYDADNSQYKFKDNNIDHTQTRDANSGILVIGAAGKQYYEGASPNNYYSKVDLYVRDADSDAFELVLDTNPPTAAHPHLDKSGYHMFIIKIYDHRNLNHGDDTQTPNTDQNGNVLKIYGTYYVNPRTILIEPLAMEKMYGEDDPTMEYCAYVNNDFDTFYMEGAFFETEFINTYFTNIYCTKDVYVEVKNADKYALSSTANKDYTYKDGSERTYPYNVYTQSTSGTYLKVNNTFVNLKDEDNNDVQKYSRDYETNTNGEFLKVDSNYYEIKSGYIYENETCTALYKSTTPGAVPYLKIGANTCVKIANYTRYTYKYTPDNSGTYIKYNNGGTIEDALIGTDEWFGALTRVESTGYNGKRYGSTYASVQNNNVGLYNIVLGNLAINSADDGKNEDYLIRMNTNYKATSPSIPYTNASDNPQTEPATLQEDDDYKTESTVQFMVRQSILTITATGSSKYYGEQDPYSNQWNAVKTTINHNTTSYLKGYTVSGYMYNDATVTDDNYIVYGVLRRKAGENVGYYDICNIAGNPSSITSACTSATEQPFKYNDETNKKAYYYKSYERYDFNSYDGNASGYNIDDGSASADLINDGGFGLITRKNSELRAISDGLRLNSDTRNYALIYVGATFEIAQSKIIIQPGVNQGKEYAANAYSDPLWQLVVYGEFTSASVAASGFNGYTAEIAATTYRTDYDEADRSDFITQKPYTDSTDSKQDDTAVYFARRKISPTIEYKYVKRINLDSYIKFKLDNGYYFEDASGTYIFAYGEYRNVSGMSGDIDITITGKLVNQEYNLFTDDFSLTRYKDSNEVVGWYKFDGFVYDSRSGGGEYPDAKYYVNASGSTTNAYVIKSNTMTGCSTGGDDSSCRNYNATFTALAPNENLSSTSYTTNETISAGKYKPDGVNACDSNAYSATCDGKAYEITFEIFKRKIILEFFDDNYTFIYGDRYQAYKQVFKINDSTNTVLESANDTIERDIFLCYSDLGDYLVNCTTNDDFGLTAGDSWSNIGLEFHLHKVISGFQSRLFASGVDTITVTETDYYDDKAIPAGEYFVYASISHIAAENYQFIYKGGTLTIKSKVTNVQLTGYTMEYADPHYSSYGFGTNYSQYTSTDETCRLDENYSITSGHADYNKLISTSCNKHANELGNDYGFVIEGLDSGDTIANNFKGRPLREAQRSSNVGKYLDVGYYEITVGTIATIKDPNVEGTFTECVNDPKGDLASNCIYKTDSTNTDVNAVNYDISYSISNNEGAYLFVLPAKLNVTVDSVQAKMYGCAYYEENYLPNTDGKTRYEYTYTYEGGYANCDGSYDEAYKFSVDGDKDNASTQGNSTGYNVTSSATGFSNTSGIAAANYKEIFEGNLYRVTYQDTGIGYSDAKASAIANKYQGQAVGKYTISLGDFNAKPNVNGQMCDAYNNPIIGLGANGKPCRNYNINYYGESATETQTSHSYTDTTNVAVGSLILYELKYQTDTTTAYENQYVIVDGKYVKIADLGRYNYNSSTKVYESNPSGEYILISSYVSISDLTSRRFSKQRQYIESTSCGEECYINLDGEYKKINSTEIKALRYNLASGVYTQSDTGSYLKVVNASDGKTNYVDLSAASKFVANSNYPYKQDNAGDYVYINGEYVQLTSLKKYKESSGVYSPVTSSDTGLTNSNTYVQIYEHRKLDSTLTRYKLDIADMYKNVSGVNITTSTENLYVFVDGSFVPYSIVKPASGTSIVATNANIDNSGSIDKTKGNVATDVVFYITARVVYVHPEYNSRAYGEADSLEYITCQEIKEAYVGSQTTGRGYCDFTATYNEGDTDSYVALGTSMYYAVQNSLAISPWTSWTDKDNANGSNYSGYNDIQFDVLQGKVSRLGNKTADDVAGKYAYDFIGVTTYNDLSGKNYSIQYVVKGNETTPHNYNGTEVLTASNTYDDLSKYVYESCNPGDNHCFVDPNERYGVYRKSVRYSVYVNDSTGFVTARGAATGVSEKSIALVNKYQASDHSNIYSYWHLGFYLIDGKDGRNGEITKWWDDAARTNGLFKDQYDEFKWTKKVSDSQASLSGFEDFAVGTREVYFEIIKRTIYLYAVDTVKTYGEADNYNDFLVAICANNEGYIANGTTISCKNTDGEPGYGLSATDKGIFLTNSNTVMNQNQIKNNGSVGQFIFNGSPGNTGTMRSFGIYFRRTSGEVAGMYTLTACATQTGVDDCTNEAPQSTPVYYGQYVGDNYNIIEIPGSLTIQTKNLTITPDSGQGFMYGNHISNGSMPNITFTEKEEGGDGLVNGGTLFIVPQDQLADASKYIPITKETATSGHNSIYKGFNKFEINGNVYHIDGLSIINSDNELEATITISGSGKNKKTVAIDGTTYLIIQTARCLVDISGLSTICINDAQNEVLDMDVKAGGSSLNVALKDKLFAFRVSYNESVDNALTNVTYQSHDVYGDSYANPANLNSRTETTTRNALSLKCSSNATGESYYNRDVCDYTIVEGSISNANTRNKSTKEIYVYVSNSRLRTAENDSAVLTATQYADFVDDLQNGTYTGTLYVKYGEDQYALLDTAKLYSYVYNTTTSKWEYSASTNGRYLKVSLENTIYAITDFTENVVFKVEKAAITVTPVTQQYKIYGEADIEIKFTTSVRYTVGRTQYQLVDKANIVQICNDSTCFTNFSDYTYNVIGGTQVANGDYIFLAKGWEVTLNTFAYSENDMDTAAITANLDYGNSKASVKKYGSSSTDLVTTNQAPSDGATIAQHFDKYTRYSDTVTTSRILIGNLYVDNWDQTVGEKAIKNGIVIAKNENGEKNYNLTYYDNSGAIKFTVIPRPVNIKIHNITKIYGQATDNVSCDDLTNCQVGEGILTDLANNGGLLVNNFEVVSTATPQDGIVGGTVSGSGATMKVNKTIVTGSNISLNVEYNTSTMNLPDDTYNASINIANLTEQKTGVNASTSYYTATGAIEKKNEHLDIKVIRNETENVAKADKSCLVKANVDRAGCEDVGEYYLYFRDRGDNSSTKVTSVENAYYSNYWGYNPNYYAIIHNNINDDDVWNDTAVFNAAAAKTGVQNDASTEPKESAALKIRKRDIQIVVETIADYTEALSATGTHVKAKVGEDGSGNDIFEFFLIQETNRYNYDSTNSKYIQNNAGTHLRTGDGEYVQIVTTGASANTYNLSSNTIGQKYIIEANMDVPSLPLVDNNLSTHHTTYDKITWYEQPLQVRTSDAMDGEVAYCSQKFDLTAANAYDEIRHKNCGGNLHYYDETTINNKNSANFFDTNTVGNYIITREKNRLYITNNNEVTNALVADHKEDLYEAHNYITDFVNGVFQIDLDETPPVINVTNEFVSKEANGAIINGTGTELEFLDALISNYCSDITGSRKDDADKTLITCKKGGRNIVFRYKEDGLNPTSPNPTPEISKKALDDLISWFGISSYDPKVMHNGLEVTNPDGTKKRYDERYYIAIQNDFEQRKTGDYSIFIYAQDMAGNISLATMVTLRVVDTTAPIVGVMNLYSAKVECVTGQNCNLEEGWTVAEDVYLPIDTLTSANINDGSLGATDYFDTSVKYAYDAYTYTFKVDNVFGTYYKIPRGTNAKAVKHYGWTNTSTGVYMTVTYDTTNIYGADNSLTYLNAYGTTSRYSQKYTVDGSELNTITKSSSGTNILFGSFVNVGNLTKYKIVEVDANGVQNGTTGTKTKLFIPDKEGTIIRYKGYYFNLSSGTYYNEAGTSTTAPDGEHQVYLYEIDGNTYSKKARIENDEKEYVIRDGQMYNIDGMDRYSSQGVHSSTGDYINIAQWDHYYSLDNGYTWSKYDRNFTQGQLVLKQDGQRLVMIKAIDQGFWYGDAGADGSDDRVHRVKNQTTSAYCNHTANGSCTDWNKVVWTSVTSNDFDGPRVMLYNMSAWETYAENGNRDRKYAYLDTILPSAQLDDKYIEIYEYGCANIANCKTNHSELFGKANDGYFYEIARLKTYRQESGPTYVLDPTGTYVEFNGVYIDITNRPKTNDGKYVYLGATDTVIAYDVMTGHINTRIYDAARAAATANKFIYNPMAAPDDREVYETTILASVAQNDATVRNQYLQNNTVKNQSGLGLGTTSFDGVGSNVDQDFGNTATYIAEKYVQINIYAYVDGSGRIKNNPFFAEGDNGGYYKFRIVNNSNKYVVKAIYSATVIKEGDWDLTNERSITGEYNSIEEAIEAIVSVYKDNGSGDNNYDFNGNDITFTIDYRTFDIAGNASPYVRKVMLITSFTTIIGVTDGNRAVAAASIEVPQNANLSQLLSEYSIGATDGDNLKSGERILQTVYYNDQLVSSRQEYDINALSNLDTTVPGTYRIVYSVQRRDGMEYVEGNSVELYVTVKPTVASVEESAIDYKAAIISLVGIIAIGLTFVYINVKKKQEN